MLRSSAPGQGWRELESWLGTLLCGAMAPESASAELPETPGWPGSPSPSSLPAHLHTAVDSGNRRDPVVLVGAQQAAEAADELLVLLAEEAEWVPVLRADFGLWIRGEPQGFDHTRQGDVGRGAAAIYLLPAHGAAQQLIVQVVRQRHQAAFAVGVAALQH